MKRLLIILSLLLLVPMKVYADNDTTTSTSTSTATGGGAATIGDINISGGGSSGSNGSDGASGISSKKTISEVRQPAAIYIGGATGVDGIGISTPFGGAVYNKGNRFQQLQALAVFKESRGMDISREIQGMERETQETTFLGIVPIDTPFGLGQMKPLVSPESIKPTKPIRDEKGQFTSAATNVPKSNGGVLTNGIQTK